MSHARIIYVEGDDPAEVIRLFRQKLAEQSKPAKKWKPVAKDKPTIGEDAPLVNSRGEVYRQPKKPAKPVDPPPGPLAGEIARMNTGPRAITRIIDTIASELSLAEEPLTQRRLVELTNFKPSLVAEAVKDKRFERVTGGYQLKGSK
jgi:hypothetical protein